MRKKKPPEPKMTYAEFASKGGKARAQKLTPEQRSESARKASQARWAKRKRRNDYGGGT